ncbi:IgGFc-binding protein-like [Rhinophrynus dorsalis]
MAPVAEEFAVLHEQLKSFEEEPMLESCQVKDGKGVCVHNYMGTCWGWGDPHYSTYDGYKFDLQGTCTYILTKYNGSDKGLQPFSIVEKNENRGNKVVSYVRVVNVDVYGHRISIKIGESPRIRVDGVLQNLPVTLNGGKIQIIRSGRTALIITDFGLRASYDWKWHVIVKIPSSYHGLTTGLCGNFNQNPKDDMMTSGNTKASSITEWAKSWKVKDQNPFCVDSCTALDCPKNSHYEPCGSACPASCADRSAPDTCREPCVETCQCNEGYVLSSDKCVPRTSCGCNKNGLYYQPNDEYWSDDTCTSYCRCDPQSSKVICEDKKCRSSERCTIVNGKRGCHPSRYSTCTASGDPHYISFDGKKFDFMGTCIYQLVKVTSTDPTLTPFVVTVQNNHRGNKAVSFTKVVTFKVYNQTITISKDYPWRILVNGIQTQLPFYYETDKIIAFIRGLHVYIKTDFDVTVTFDWNSYCRVIISEDYANAVSGLCGNSNKDPSDDFIMSNGKKTGSATEFGNSWKVGEVPGCTKGCQGSCPTCKEENKEKYKSEQFCGILTKVDGPFKNCHASIDPTPYFNDCVFDTCYFEGQSFAFTSVITNYVSACQAALIVILEWRVSLTRLVCPPNSHYELCGTGCNPTCYDLSSPRTCKSSCTEGCYCDNGFILSGGNCVPIAECGQDKVTSLGNEFITVFMQNHNPKWESHPELLVTGTAQSTSVSVTINKSDFKKDMNVKKGETIRIPITESVEMIGSDISTKVVVIKSDADVAVVSRNYKTYTFDTALVYPVHRLGSEYYIITPPWGTTKDYKEFAVVSFKKTTNVDIYLKGAVNFQGQTYPKGSKLSLTLEPYQAVQIQSEDDLSGTKVVTQHPAAVLSGHSCSHKYGTCAHIYEQLLPVPSWGKRFFIPGLSFQPNFDIVFIVASQDTTIDFQSGKQINKKNLQAGEVIQLEVTYSSPVVINASHPIQVLFYGAGENIKDEVIDPFFTTIPSTEAFGLQYELIGQESIKNNLAVIITKVSGQKEITVDDNTLKGLQWKEFPGTDYSWGEYTYDSGFSFHKVQNLKQPFGLLNIGFQFSLAYGSVAPCLLDPCSNVNCRAKETCQVKNGKGVCVYNYMGTCWGWGDPHYSTYDGYKFDLQGTCTYILTKYNGSDTGLQPFSIEEKNENRGNKVVSYVRVVNIDVYGHRISIKIGESPRIRVDGVLQNLPVTLNGGKIQIIRSGRTALIITDFGLRASYDWKWHVIVKIPSSYHGLTTGLCGNFNQNPKDDMMTSGNTKASSITEWAKSWKVKDQDPFCVDSCTGNCPSCDENIKKKYTDENSCGIITASNGPFKNCQSAIDPENFLTSCIYDVCMNGGAMRFLCQAVDAFATECRNQGIKVSTWRDIVSCPLDCPKNSHYEACGSACPASCADRSAPDTCKEPCVETCQCDEGYVLSSDKCVPSTSCGCNKNGLYYQPNDEYWSDDTCTSYCRCDPQSGKVICEDKKCRSSERCTIVNGKRGCHPSRYSTCTASGDPHYISFDGKKFDFMGTCIYQLVKVTSTDPTLTPFVVTVQNNHRGNKAVSFTKVVTFKVYNQTITISKDYPWRILVNGIQTQLPFYYETDKVIAFIRGLHVYIKTDFDLTVTFDWNSYARVIISEDYANAVSGLCGNSNKDPSDDFTMSNGKKTESPTEFGNSWKVGEVPGCTKGCQGSCPTCKEENKEKYKSEQFCGILTKVDGPFKNCHASIDPTPYFNDCVFDTCYFEGQSFAFTSVITNYVSACQAALIVILEWRVSLTRLVCPPNSHYELCGTGCNPTCYGLSSPRTCKSSCTEGCYCDNGFILSGGNCVPIAECGCLYKGIYYLNGKGAYIDDTCLDKVTSLGKEFITVFMQNHNPKWESHPELLVTGTAQSTSVSVTINKSDFKKDMIVKKGETIRIPVTEPVEMIGSDTSPKVVVIKSDADVTVVSRNYKTFTVDTALVYPVHRLGSEYYIITPPWGTTKDYKEFAVVSVQKPTNVDIYLKGEVNFKGQTYPKGSKLSLTLEPYQAVQIQSGVDLSGTKVVAQHPVAVLSGHSCSHKYGMCAHIYEQLLPVPSWGKRFFIPGLSFQPNFDIAFIVASQDSTIDFQSGKQINKKNLQAGEVIQLEVTFSSPVVINASHPIQVLFYGAGGTMKDEVTDPFFTTIPSTEAFGLQYELIGQDNIKNNLAIIITKVSGQKEITVDDNTLKGIEWKEFPETDYSWGEYTYDSGFSFHKVQNLKQPFGLLSIGFQYSLAYGNVAPCLLGK